jgi:biofilm PGA synthesis N-glycosyltransferase PgaC
LVCAWVVVAALIQVIFREATSRQLPNEDDELPSVAILVPAKNEEAVVASCLEALLAVDYPEVEIFLLSDGSIDRTVEIARTFEGRGVKVLEFLENRGKSETLESALESLRTDLAMIVDADTRLAPNAVREMASHFTDTRLGGVTANVRVAGGGSFLARLQQMEYASIVGLTKRAAGLFGGLFTVSGAAACFRVSAVREVGGFRSVSATEDIELSWRLQRVGWLLSYAPRARVEISVPHRLPALWRQRRRWSQGLVEVLRLHGDLWRHSSSVLVPFMIEALSSMLWAFLLVATLAVLIALWFVYGDLRAVHLNFWSLQAFTMALFIAQSISAWVLDRHYARQPLWLLSLSLLYPFYFLAVILPSAITGWGCGLFSEQTGRWERTERV